MRRLYLCGAGNSEGVRLALRVNERERRWDDLALLDDDPSKLGGSQIGVSVVGPFSVLECASPKEAQAVNLVARTTAARRAAAERITGMGIPLTGLLSPDVDVLGAEVAPDVMAYQYSTIGPEVRIGRGSVVFMGAAVGHECTVGAYCVLAANSVLNARVRLGDGVYVGSNAVVLPEVEIGEGATIGAGAVVISDVPPKATVLAGVGEVIRFGGEPAVTLNEGELEATVAAAWGEVLGAAEVNPRVNFFDAGGTSLLAMRLLQRIESSAGVALRSVDLFQHPTLTGFTRRVQDLAGESGGTGPADGSFEAAKALDSANQRAAGRKARFAARKARSAARER